MTSNTCRFCGTILAHTFVDLGAAPLCNRLVTPESYFEPEEIFPQHVKVCSKCYLVQLPHQIDPSDIFTRDYSYFSGFSQDWLKHCENYVSMIAERLCLTGNSTVMEIASNDGSLLRYFIDKSIPCLGVEPTENTAIVARNKGVPTVSVFFTEENAKILRNAYGVQDLIIGNNVLAHVPDINDFVRGLKLMLAPHGTITMEFPSVHDLIAKKAWDTIYHEHFSYLSFTTVSEIFQAHGLQVFDVEPLPTHGGSLRIYARHTVHEDVSNSVRTTLLREEFLGVRDMATYLSFGEQVQQHKLAIWKWLANVKDLGYSIAGYGAPGKGNTMLNYCGIRKDIIDFVVDENPHKQGCYLPGSRIQILHPDAIAKYRPDYVLILPWNWQNEIAAKLAHIKQWGGKCVVFMPEVNVLCV